MTAVLPPMVCQPWCTHDDPLNHDGEGGWSHSRDYAEGRSVQHCGPLYSVALQHVERDDETELFVTVESSTLTADQAEVLGRALIAAAADLRKSPRPAAKVRFGPYWAGHGYVHPSPEVVAPTPAEQEVSRAASEH